MKKIIITAIAILGFAILTKAQTWKNFTVGMHINDIAVDSLGDIWCAYEFGLAHFHNNQLVNVITNPLTPGNLNIDKILIDKNGRKLIVQNTGLYFYFNNRWGCISSSSPWNFTKINAIEIGTDGKLYVGCNNALYDVIDTIVNSTYSYNGASVNCIKADLNGGIWVAFANRGVTFLNQINGTVNTNLKTTDGLISSNITSIDVDNSNTKWFGSTSGISKYSTSSAFTNFSKSNSPFPDDNVISIKSFSGTTYVLFSSKLMSYNSGKWSMDSTLKYNLPINLIRLDKNGALYVAKTIGLDAYLSNSWINLNDGLLNKKCYSIGIDEDNIVYVAEMNSVTLLKNETIIANWNSVNVLGIKSLSHINDQSTQYLKKPFLWYAESNNQLGGLSNTYGPFRMGVGAPQESPVAKYVGANLTETKEELASGKNWFATFDNGLTSYGAGPLTNYKAGFSGLISNQVYSLEIDKGNNKWIGTSRGLQKFDGTTWTTYTRNNNGILSDTILSLAFDKDSNLWIGTPFGLSKFNGSTCVNYTSANTGVPLTWLTKIRFDKLGGLWVGTGCDRLYVYGGILTCDNGKGLIHYDGVNWSLYNTSNSGIIANSVYDVAIDKNNNKWIATSEGLSLFKFQTTSTKIEETNKIIHNLTVYPNPTKDRITIDNGDITKMSGYSIKIFNSIGQQKYQSAINQQQFTIDITQLGSNGLYYLNLIDDSGNIVVVKKILLNDGLNK